MSLQVAAPLRGEAPAELWMAPQRVQPTETRSVPAAANYDALVTRFESATACGVATVVADDQHVDKDYLDATGFHAPLLLHSPAQVDLMVPPQGAMTLKELETAIGAERRVRAIDVASQRELASEMKLQEWMEYFGHPPSQRERVLNLISLECTGTGLDTKVRPPKMLKDIGWVEKHWANVGGKPASVRMERARMPKVRLYCLMSAAGSYTEFHVDFGGSSVWYHLYKGRKFFFVIPPTDANLDKFAEWEDTYKHGKAQFFGDLVPLGECTVVEMRAGDTMLLPSGWIHAVYTPDDSISFGGNFLSGYHMATQLQCHAKEKGQQIEGRFFFPEFECVVWYAATYYARMLETCPTMLNKWEKRDLPRLVDALRAWLSGGTHGVACAPDPEVLSRVEKICSTAAHCKPSEMLQKMTKKLGDSIIPDDEQKKQASEERAVTTGVELGTTSNETATAPPSIVHLAPIDEPHDSISRITTDDSSSSSSSSSEDSSSDSSDPSTPESSDGEDTAKDNDDEPPGAGDDDNGETNESSSDSSSDDDSSSSSGSDNEEEKPTPAPDAMEPQREEEPEEFDEPEESSSSDSDNDFDPESAYPDLPPVPVDALIAIRKRARLKELQITKQGKEEIIAMARQHLIERQKSVRSKKKHAKGANGGVAAAAIATWREDDHWVVACSCGLGGPDYDDGSEMVECNNCKTWVHIGCVRILIHDIFWCHKCRDSENDWLFVCPCGVKEKNYDDGKRMVQCGMCETWQHTLCGGIKDTDEPPEVYECTSCRKLRKKKKPSSSSQKNSKKSSKSKSARHRSDPKRAGQLSIEKAGFLAPVLAAAPPLPSPTTDTSSSPPPPPPPPPSAPPSPVAFNHDYHAASVVTKIMIPPDSLPNPVPKRKRGRPPLGKSKKKSKEYDEDYRDNVGGRGTPAGANGVSLITRPPLPMTPKSSAATGKRKSGSSARDRLEKKLKTRKPRA